MAKFATPDKKLCPRPPSPSAPQLRHVPARIAPPLGRATELVGVRHRQMEIGVIGPRFGRFVGVFDRQQIVEAVAAVLVGCRQFRERRFGGRRPVAAASGRLDGVRDQTVRIAQPVPEVRVGLRSAQLLVNLLGTARRRSAQGGQQAVFVGLVDPMVYVRRQGNGAGIGEVARAWIKVPAPAVSGAGIARTLAT